MTAKRKAPNWHLWPIAIGITVGLAISNLIGIVSLPWYAILAPLLILSGVTVVVLAAYGALVFIAVAAKQGRK